MSKELTIIEEEKSVEEPWKMTREDAYWKEIDLRQDRSLTIGAAEVKLRSAIGRKRIFAYSSEVQLASNRNKIIKFEGRYVFKDKLTPEIREAMENLKKVRKEADEKYIREATPLNAHYETVKKAVYEGKPVPRKVLEEYKDEKWADEALAKLLKVEKKTSELGKE